MVRSTCPPPQGGHVSAGNAKASSGHLLAQTHHLMRTFPPFWSAEVAPTTVSLSGYFGGPTVFGNQICFQYVLRFGEREMGLSILCFQEVLRLGHNVLQGSQRRPPICGEARLGRHGTFFSPFLLHGRPARRRIKPALSRAARPAGPGTAWPSRHRVSTSNTSLFALSCQVY
jgi:hypothetical protein